MKQLLFSMCFGSYIAYEMTLLFSLCLYLQSMLEKEVFFYLFFYLFLSFFFIFFFYLFFISALRGGVNYRKTCRETIGVPVVRATYKKGAGFPKIAVYFLKRTNGLEVMTDFLTW